MSTGRDLHIDVPLSNLVVESFNDGMGQFIAGQVLPSVPVGKQSDKYYTIDSGAFLRVHDTKRAPKTKANLVEFDVSSDSYFADNFALGAEASLEDLANADTALRLRQNNTRLVTTGLLRDYEVRVANRVTSISNVGSGVALTGGNKWSDYANSDPIANVTTAHAFIRQRTGVVANTLIVDEDTIAIARRHPVLLDLYKYTSGGQLNDAQLAEVFKVQRLLVGRGIKRNEVEGATASITNIWGNNAVLAYIDGTPGGLQTVTFGLSMRWQPAGFPSPLVAGRQTFAGPGTRNVEITEAQYFQAEKIVARDLAYAITGTL